MYASPQAPSINSRKKVARLTKVRQKVHTVSLGSRGPIRMKLYQFLSSLSDSRTPLVPTL